jgi:hypothetical protein
MSQNGFVWLDKRDKEDSATILGNIEIKDGKLTLSSNSKKRLEKGKKLIIKNIANAVVHKADSFQDPMEAVKSFKDIPHHEPENNIPMEVQQQIYSQFMRKHCTKWLNEKIPALEGKTPVQAVKTEDGRKKVVELLKSFENIEEHNKKEGRPFYDLSWMWGSLGLEREL